MIDILIPALDEIYDFEVSAQVCRDELTRKVIRLVEEKEHVDFGPEERFLFFFKKGDFLNAADPIGAQGVVSGDRLILV